MRTANPKRSAMRRKTQKTLLDTVIEYYLIGAAVIWLAYVVGFWMR